MRIEYSQYCQPAGWEDTQPHREHLALEHLQRKDFQAYWPFIRHRLSRARRVSEVLRPLFSGYLFVKILPTMQHWQPLMSSVGVRSIVRCGDVLSLIDDGFVQSLKAREVEGCHLPARKPLSSRAKDAPLRRRL